jgi:hypothetical protein
MDKQKKREQKRPEGLRPEFPRVRAHESSGIRPRLGSQHLPIPPPLQTQPIPEPPEPKLDQKYLDWLDEQKRHNSKSFKKKRQHEKTQSLYQMMILEMLQFMVYTKNKVFTDLLIGTSFLTHGIESGKIDKKIEMHFQQTFLLRMDYLSGHKLLLPN